MDQELQEERLVGSGTSGSYALLDDLFAGERHLSVLVDSQRGVGRGAKIVSWSHLRLRGGPLMGHVLPRLIGFTRTDCAEQLTNKMKHSSSGVRIIPLTGAPFVVGRESGVERIRHPRRHYQNSPIPCRGPGDLKLKRLEYRPTPRRPPSPRCPLISFSSGCC